MEAKSDHPSRMRTLTTVSKPSRTIGVKISPNGRQSPKSPLLSSRPLLARITSRDPPPEVRTSQCSMNMTSYSPTRAPEDIDNPNQAPNAIAHTKKTLMERIGLVSDPFPRVNRPSQSSANSTNHPMPGKFRKKYRLPSFQDTSSHR